MVLSEISIWIIPLSFSGCLSGGRAFYRYSVEQKQKVICYFHQFPIKEVSLSGCNFQIKRIRY